MISLSVVLAIPRANGASLSPVTVRTVRVDEDPVRTTAGHCDRPQVGALSFGVGRRQPTRLRTASRLSDICGLLGLLVRFECDLVICRVHTARDTVVDHVTELARETEEWKSSSSGSTNCAICFICSLLIALDVCGNGSRCIIDTVGVSHPV